MYKVSFLRNDPKPKTGTLSDKYLALDKAIYTHPIAIDTDDLSTFRKPTRYVRANNEEIVLDLGYVAWLELAVVVFLFFFLGYQTIYRPIYDYNMDINVVRELAETGKSSYSEELQDKFGDEAATRYYIKYGLDEYREIAFHHNNLILVVIFGPMALGAIYWMNLCAKHCRDRLTFNRKNGTVHYRYLYGFRSNTCGFDQAIFQSLRTSFVRSDNTYLAMRFPHSKSPMMVSPALPYISISQYVWFMDLNRPLPPGTAFDAYREEDYLRRKKEGFTAPMYPSGIPTPEADYLIKKYGDYSAKKRSESNYVPALKALAASENALRDS